MEPASTDYASTLSGVSDTTVKDLFKIDQNLDDYKAGTRDALTGKDITILMGMTGAGKSTLLNAMLNPDGIEFDDDEGSYIVKEGSAVQQNGREMFKISADVISGTKIPGFKPSSTDNHVFVDAPGCGDTNELDEYPNMTIIHDIIVRAKSVSIVLCFNGADITSERGKNLYQVATMIARYISRDFAEKEDLSKILFPICTNTGAIDNTLSMKASIKKVLDLVQTRLQNYKNATSEKRQFNDKEKENFQHFKETKYASDQELPAVLKILEHIHAAVRVTDPVDEMEEDDEDFTNVVLVGGLRQQLEDLASSGKALKPEPSVIEADINLVLHEFIMNQTKKLKDVEGWTEQAELQTAIDALYKNMLSPWEGGLKLDLQNTLGNICNLLNEDDFAWCERAVYGRINTVFVEDQPVPALEKGQEEAFAQFFTAFFQEHKLSNENDFGKAFPDSIYAWSIDWFVANAKIFEQPGKSSTCIRASPKMINEEGMDADITFAQAIGYFAKVGNLKSLKPKQKGSWKTAFRGAFFKWFAKAWPSAYEIRYQPVNLQVNICPGMNIGANIKFLVGM